MATALVTGASSGIGRELARLVAADGHAVILVARSKDRLDALASQLRAEYSVPAHVIPADLSDPAAPQAVIDAVRSRGLEIDHLINNAAFGMLGPFSDQDASKLAGMIQVNVSSLVLLTRLLVPEMIARGSGRILNVASIAGFLPGPMMAVYYATKAFVVSFSEALASELHSTGVSVTCLCPGPTRTEFQQRAGMGKLSIFKGPFAMEAGPVAQKAYTGMMRGRMFVIPGLSNGLIPILLRFLPRSFVPPVVRRVQSRT